MIVASDFELNELIARYPWFATGHQAIGETLSSVITDGRPCGDIDGWRMAVHFYCYDSDNNRFRVTNDGTGQPVTLLMPPDVFSSQEEHQA